MKVGYAPLSVCAWRCKRGGEVTVMHRRGMDFTNNSQPQYYSQNYYVTYTSISKPISCSAILRMSSQLNSIENSPGMSAKWYSNGPTKSNKIITWLVDSSSWECTLPKLIQYPPGLSMLCIFSKYWMTLCAVSMKKLQATQSHSASTERGKKTKATF